MVRSVERWYDPARIFTHPEDLASLAALFARQFEPEGLVQEMIALAESDSGRFRNVHPRESEDCVHERESQAWTRESGRQKQPPTTSKAADHKHRSGSRDRRGTAHPFGTQAGSDRRVHDLWKVQHWTRCGRCPGPFHRHARPTLAVPLGLAFRPLSRDADDDVGVDVLSVHGLGNSREMSMPCSAIA
jgi:hypothetical protein